MFRPTLAALFCATVLGGCASTGEPAGYVFVEQPCELPAEAGDVACGAISVPEDYANPQGRPINLNVVLLRAGDPQTPRRAIFELMGGPGFGVTDDARNYWTFLAPLRRRNDIVLFDMRGTGRSNVLYCSAIDAYRRADRNAPLYPPDLVSQCVAEVAQHADRRHYTTENAARDIDAVRQALGYDRIDLSGGSYGSTLGLAYMAEFPHNVRAAFLSGLAPDTAMPPLAHAVGAQRALLMYFDACASEPACNAAFPDLRGDLERVRARLADGQPFAFEIFMERMRERMYQPGPARELPLVIHRAAQGNFDGFMSAPPGGTGRVLGDGLYLSITCAESFPFFDYDEAAARSNAGHFGDYRLRRQRDACAVWDVPPARTPSPRGPLNIPVVFMSGDFDPATPPAWAEEAIADFPSSRHLLLIDGGHGPGGLTNLECLVAIQAAFHDNPDPDVLDVSCAESVRRPPFVLQ